jgi:hypothetical protein
VGRVCRLINMSQTRKDFRILSEIFVGGRLCEYHGVDENTILK